MPIKITVSEGQNQEEASTVDFQAKEAVTASPPGIKIKKRKLPPPNWKAWQQKTSIFLWKAVALSCNFRPVDLERVKKYHPDKYSKYKSRLGIAISWLKTDLEIVDHPSNGTCSEQQMVKLVDFIECAESKDNIKLLKGLSDIAKSRNPPGRASETTSIDEPKVLAPSSSTVSDIKTAVQKKGQKSQALIERDRRLQKAADIIAAKLKAEMKGRLITKELVATYLRKEEQWREMERKTILRNIRITWRNS